jgi:Zn-dependent protease
MVIALIIAIVFHEVAHGFASYMFGDHTAKKMGRLSLNPIKHIDPIGTILLPLILIITQSPILFGYAKPVPVVFENLRPKRLGMFLVAFAGPLANFFLAFIFSLILVKGPTFNNTFSLILSLSIRINIFLGCFNLFPLLPLDGGRMVYAVLPSSFQKIYGKTEPFGFFILVALLLIPSLLISLGMPSFPIISKFVILMSNYVYQLFDWLVP